MRPCPGRTLERFCFVFESVSNIQAGRCQPVKTEDTSIKCCYNLPCYQSSIILNPPSPVTTWPGVWDWESRHYWLVFWCHTTSHHTTSHHITSHHITSHHTTSHHTTPHHITPHHIASRHIAPSHPVT